MVSPAISITRETTLKEMIELLSKHRFSGLPVLDADGKVAGILSDTDIVRYSQKIKVVPHVNLSGWISPHAEITDLASLRKGIDLLEKTIAGAVMTQKVYTVAADTEVAEVARLMNRRKINRVPVIDNEGKLLGIITRTDLIAYMAKK
jgi:CBS domain-containing protein